MPRVELPSSFRSQAGGQARVEVTGATVGEVLRGLVARYPALKLFDERGELTRYVNVFLGDDDVRSLKALATPVTPTDVLLLVTAVAGW